MPDAHQCARLLLETLPSLMRGIGGAMRQHKPGEDEPLSIGQLRMLDVLSCAPRTLGELAAGHHVTPSSMSRAVDVLVRRDWVERRVDPEDRRQVILTLTEDGRTAHEAMHARTEEVVAQMIGRLADDERARLYDGLAILRTLLDRPE